MDLTAFLSAIGLRETALQAAAIQGLFTLLGIVITGVLASFAYGRNRSADRRVARRLRREKTFDLQTAIRAEARAQFYELDSDTRIDTRGQDLVEKIDEGRWQQQGFTPFVLRHAPSVVFPAVEADLALLENDVIEAVTEYYRQRALAAQFAEDLRADRYFTSPVDRKIDMLRRYYGVQYRLKIVSAHVVDVIETTLKLPIKQRDLSMQSLGRMSADEADPIGALALPASVRSVP